VHHYFIVDLNNLNKNKYITKTGVIGKVEEYVIRYELQHCGYVHVHVILWVKQKDVKNIGT